MWHFLSIRLMSALYDIFVYFMLPLSDIFIFMSGLLPYGWLIYSLWLKSLRTDVCCKQWLFWLDWTWLFLMDSDWLFLMTFGWLFLAGSNNATSPLYAHFANIPSYDIRQLFCFFIILSSEFILFRHLIVLCSFYFLHLHTHTFFLTLFLRNPLFLIDLF